MNTNQIQKPNYYERLCTAYNTAVELKEYYRSIGDKDSFWRYLKICIDILKAKTNYSKN